MSLIQFKSSSASSNPNWLNSLSSLTRNPMSPDPNPKWGFGAELKDEKHATDSLASVVSTVLAGRCNMVKNTILGSLSSDPEEGTTTTALHPGATDENLTSVHAKHPDLVMQSRFIKRYVLDLDFQTYGAVNLISFTTPSVLIAGPSTAPQAAAVATASGNDSNS
ncbi:hypothetical protein B0H14DRAFT_3880930 [Mycena olivaceomarginata]|nr:hypothetical protein B0H14DRAFT_3880930 [Mycena olivaceomarginata]